MPNIAISAWGCRPCLPERSDAPPERGAGYRCAPAMHRLRMRALRARKVLPVGFRRELARLVVATLPALALLLAWDAFLLLQGRAWLSAWLPAGLAVALVAAHVAAGLGLLALTYGSLPLFAYRRTLLRLRSSDA